MEIEQKNSKLKKLGGNIAVFAIGSFACKLMNYLLLPFYTSILSQAQYGVYDIVVTTSNLLFPVFTLLITEATIRFALDRDINYKKVFTISLVTVSIGMVVYLAVSPLILLSQSYKQYYIHFIAYHFLTVYYTVVSQYCKGIEKTKVYAVSGILGTVVTLSFNILLMVVFKYGLTGYFVSAYIGTAVSTVYIIVRCKLWQDIVRLDKKDTPLFKQMVKYSMPIMPNSISWWVSTSSDKYIISFFDGQSQMGLYSAAYKIPSLMTVFTTIFFKAWQISSVDEFGSEDSKKMYAQVYELLFTIVVLISGLVIWFSKFFTSIIFAEKFFEAWRFVPYLILAYVFHDLSAYIGSVYTAAKKTKTLFTSTMIGAVLNITLNIIVIPKVGAIGGAVTTLISYFVVYVVRLHSMKKVMMFYMKHINNTLCLTLLFTEVVLVEIDAPYMVFFNGMCFGALILLNYKTIYIILLSMVNEVKKRCHIRKK